LPTGSDWGIPIHHARSDEQIPPHTEPQSITRCRWADSHRIHLHEVRFFNDRVDSRWFYSQVQKQNLVPFTHFATDMNNNNLPEISFVIPNRNDDAHDGTLQQADTWLRNNIAPLLNNHAFQQDGILILVFDEAESSDGSHGGGGFTASAIGDAN
jgi:Phosphoesterase family